MMNPLRPSASTGEKSGVSGTDVSILADVMRVVAIGGVARLLFVIGLVRSCFSAAVAKEPASPTRRWPATRIVDGGRGGSSFSRHRVVVQTQSTWRVATYLMAGASSRCKRTRPSRRRRRTCFHRGRGRRRELRVPPVTSMMSLPQVAMGGGTPPARRRGGGLHPSAPCRRADTGLSGGGGGLERQNFRGRRGLRCGS